MILYCGRRQRGLNFWDRSHTVDQQRSGFRGLRGLVARYAGVVAVVQRRGIADLQAQIELAELMSGCLVVLERPVVLEPLDGDGGVALAHRAGNVDPSTCLNIRGKAKRIDFWRN